MDGPQRPAGSDTPPAQAPRALPGAAIHKTTRSAFSDVHADPARDGTPRDIRPRRRDPESPADPRTPDEGDPADPRAPRPGQPGDVAAPTIGTRSADGDAGSGRDDGSSPESVRYA